MNCVIFDLDGTLFNCEHRMHFIRNKPKNFKKFYEAMEDDTPIEEMVQLVNMYSSYGIHILISTGRPVEYFNQTYKSLQKYNIPCTGIYMRRDNDYRSDFILKKENLAKMLEVGYKPIMAFEDRTQCVKMYRENGIRCLQVCDGDY